MEQLSPPKEDPPTGSIATPDPRIFAYTDRSRPLSCNTVSAVKIDVSLKELNRQ
jgi:hypothetical protein